MPNPKPNTSGLRPLDSERAREIASKPRISSEPVVKKQITLTREQSAWLADNAPNASGLIRRLLQEHIDAESS
jgi:hypothetical protein